MKQKSAEAIAPALSGLVNAFSESLLILVLLDNASLDQLVNQLLH